MIKFGKEVKMFFLKLQDQPNYLLAPDQPKLPVNYNLRCFLKKLWFFMNFRKQKH
jgi:hypothetical protein